MSIGQAERRQAFLTHVFLGEIEFQAQLAARAAERLAKNEADFDSLDLWSAIQSILTAAANVSRILWPARKKYEARGAMLRQLLKIDKNNPLCDRNVRNHFEHYDERIEDWLASADSATYIDQIIGPLPGLLRHFSNNAHRRYDPSTQTLTFRGEALSLRSIVGGLGEIRQNALSVTEL